MVNSRGGTLALLSALLSEFRSALMWVFGSDLVRNLVSAKASMMVMQQERRLVIQLELMLAKCLAERMVICLAT